MLMVTAGLIGLIFMNLYEKTTMDNYKDKLQEQAKSISARMTEFIEYENYDDWFEYSGILEEIGFDVWTISNPDAFAPMDERMETTSLEEISDSKDYLDIVESAFLNKKDYRKSEDKYYEVPMITVAVPVIGTNREVVGAVLLKSYVEDQNDIIKDSLSLILYSILIALAISFIIVIVFARQLSGPISRMRGTALDLASGNYKSKTNISRNDELGDLAKTIDILSERLLENDIQRKNLDQMRLDFFANVSHELRTPITVVRAYTETLVDGIVTDKDKIAQYYERMLSECKSMERLVGDLLLLSKMQNPDFLIEKEPVNLAQIFDDTIRTANVMGEQKNIKIDVIKDMSVYMMLGDYDRLRQMFLIVLDNAIKFSQDNKTIHIKLSNEDTIKISIKDEGVGIEPEDIPNIFEKFYKSNLRQNEKGSGLGLAIAKQIALKHKGDIEVFSMRGDGTEFVFSFPWLVLNS